MPGSRHRRARRTGVASLTIALSLAAGTQVAAAQDAAGAGAATAVVTAAPLPLDVTVDPRRAQVVAYLVAQLGKPYVFGAHGPDAFDCSGLVQMAYAAAGVSVGWDVAHQLTDGVAITDYSALQPGDLVFTPGADGTPQAPGHVGIYVGDGLIIHAPHTGDVVRYVKLSSWLPKIAQVRRVL